VKCISDHAHHFNHINQSSDIFYRW